MANHRFSQRVSLECEEQHVTGLFALFVVRKRMQQGWPTQHLCCRAAARRARVLLASPSFKTLHTSFSPALEPSHYIHPSPPTAPWCNPLLHPTRSSPEKRAPFYHWLRTLSLARHVSRGLRGMGGGGGAGEEGWLLRGTLRWAAAGRGHVWRTACVGLDAAPGGCGLRYLRPVPTKLQ